MTSVALALSVVSVLTASPPPSPGCGYDADKLMALAPGAFDQDLSGGWRELSNRKCHVEAATVLRDYRQAHLQC